MNSPGEDHMTVSRSEPPHAVRRDWDVTAWGSPNLADEATASRAVAIGGSPAISRRRALLLGLGAALMRFYPLAPHELQPLEPTSRERFQFGAWNPAVIEEWSPGVLERLRNLPDHAIPIPALIRGIRPPSA